MTQQEINDITAALHAGTIASIPLPPTGWRRDRIDDTDPSQHLGRPYSSLEFPLPDGRVAEITITEYRRGRHGITGEIRGVDWEYTEIFPSLLKIS